MKISQAGPTHSASRVKLSFVDHRMWKGKMSTNTHSPSARLVANGTQTCLTSGLFPPLRLAAAFGPATDTVTDLRTWLGSFDGVFKVEPSSSLVRILSPGSCLTVAVGMTPSSLLQIATSMGTWLVAHHGPDLLYDCQLALGEACFFVYVPRSVGNTFANAIQVV